MRYGILAASLRALVPAILFLTALTASADGPAPPAGGTPTAGRLQSVHESGQEVGENTARAERVQSPFGSGFANAPDDLLRSKLDDYLKEHGSQWSEAEREVFTEAYWKGANKENDRGGMTQINPPTLMGASPTTVVSGKTATPGPGTLQLTDAEGNSYFVDVDAKGNYSTTVPQSGFEPTKMTLRTGTVKAAWKLKDGKWMQIASATGTPGIQGVMAPTRGSAVQQVAYVDECKQYAVIGSLDHESLPVAGLTNPWLRPVLFRLLREAIEDRSMDPRIYLVSDPLPPDVLRGAQQQGIDHADHEFEKSQLEKIPRGERTKEQADRLKKLDDMLNDYDKFKNNPFGNKDTIDAAERAAQARRLQRQADQMRADPKLGPAADSLDQTARSLMGGQALPPLRASANQPLQWPSSTTGAMAPGTPGGALAQTPGAPSTGMATAIAQMGTYTIKGTAKMGSAVGIPKGTLVSGVMVRPDETPEHFVRSNPVAAVGLPDTKTGVAAPPGDFAAGDDQAPLLTEVRPNGTYQYDYKVGIDYGLGKNLALGVEYKAVFSAGVNYGCAKQSFADLAAGKEMPTTAIEDRTQLIKGMKPGANLWQVDEEFVNHGLGHIQGWDPWESPKTSFNPGTWFSYKIAESDIPKFNQFGSWFFNTVGPNSGINTAPAPAWKPENWANDQPKGIPTARVSRNGGRP